jgi:hypothetical protein
MDRSIKAGVSGFLLAVVINLLSPIYLYFIPSFLVVILVIYVFRLRDAQRRSSGCFYDLHLLRRDFEHPRFGNVLLRE